MSALQYNPAVLEEEATYVAELFHQFQITLESCIPCIVTEYSPNENTVSVQPIPQRVIDTDNGIVHKDRPVIPSVPILRFLHGGFSISSPIFVGDTGYLIASDRSCSSAQKENSATLFSDDNQKEKNKGSLPPDDLSLGQYTSGFFLPCSWSKEGNHNGELVIEGIGKQPNDGKWQKIRLSNDGIITIETKDKQIVISKDGISLSSGEVKLSVLDDKIVTDCNNSRIEQAKDFIEIKHGTNKIVLDEKGITYSGNVDESGTIISDIRYDKSSHQIQVRRQPVARCGNMFVNVGKVGDWEMITGGQAIQLPTE